MSTVDSVVFRVSTRFIGGFFMQGESMNELVSVENIRTEEQAVINAIIESKGANLPATIEDLVPMIEFSKARATAFRALCDAASKVSEQEELNRAALESGQRWGVVHLYGIRRLGEITREMPQTKVTVTSDGRSLRHGGDRGKMQTLQEQGISARAYGDAERIASHPEVLDRVVEQAQQRGDIPTKTSVLNQIRMEEAKRAAERQRDTVRAKIVKEVDKGVSDYFASVKMFRRQLELTVEGARRERWFSPESINIVKKKHAELRELFNQLEEAINE